MVEAAMTDCWLTMLTHVAEAMAAQQYAGHLVRIPDLEEVTEPVADFLTSGLLQVERVFKGPRPRIEV
jgi:hypothetical protein